LILIAATFWILHYTLSNKQSKLYRPYAVVVGPMVIVLCLIGIYGAKSKGVWLALGCTFPVLVFFMIGWVRSKAVILVLLVSTIVVGAGLYAVSSNLQRTAGPTLSATVALENKIAMGAPVGPAVASAIGDRSTPMAMDERLQLWSNSWELFSTAPILGLGNEWVVLWTHTHYTAVKYTMMHDGYLEILVRYGIVGMVVFAAMLFFFVRAISRATRMGLVPRFALPCYLTMSLFFALTLLSNSNNRLPIGESFMLLSSAFALACGLKMHASQKENELVTVLGRQALTA
jgi:O-antigen ligase